VVVPSPGVHLLGALVPGAVVSGAGANFVGAPGSGAVVSGAGANFVEAPTSGTVVPLEALGLRGVPPGQRELRGKRSHKTLNPSGVSLISVAELVDELVDSSTGDLLD